MVSSFLALVLCSQVVPEGKFPPTADTPRKVRIERIKQERIIRARVESLARKERIARDWESGMAVDRHYPHLANPYYQQQQLLISEYYHQRLLYLQFYQYNY